MSRLIALAYSPWSEKARWALDHHGIVYDELPHTPMLGELKLRATVKKWRGRVTVPVLLDDAGHLLTDSLDIARYAERTGNGTALFPADQDAAIVAWNARSDRALAAGRAKVVARLAESSAALRESLPPFARALGPVSTGMGRMGVRFFQRKYALRATEANAATVRDALDTLRHELGGRDTVLEHFSYADITAALLLQAVVPVDDRYIRLGPATREAWTNPELARDYADLVAWRDRLYARHRRRPRS